MLDKINSPDDLKQLPVCELPMVAGEIRREILDVVSREGGHLASNLGTVELALALHYVFDCPSDSIIFDVGHQCYAHKIITSRYKEFDTLRKFGGISGFTNRGESVFDTVTAGHSGSSVSAALGIAYAKRLKGDNSYTIAVAGDGSFTNGMIYEALNNCSVKDLNLIIVLNDNGMSISDNVGGLSDYLSVIRTSEGYFAVKCFFKKGVSKIPLIGNFIVRAVRAVKNAFKRLILNTNMFESLGLEYLGPVDGNNVKKLVSIFEEAKSRCECTIIHAKTKKGLGYAPAQANPDKYHFAPPFDLSYGILYDNNVNFASAVSDIMISLGMRDPKVCAVTAAMPVGTGLSEFAKMYPDRFFDVGIAEEHAVTFSGGLSLAGMKPVCVIYSTFAQRVYDQLLHDIALQNTPFTFLLSHAGLVAGDGCTHQGIFDVALFSSVPDVNIFAPDSYNELCDMVSRSVDSDTIDIIRYPKDKETVYDRSSFTRKGESVFEFNTDAADVVIITYGRMTSVAYDAAKKVSYAKVGVVRAAKLCPLETDVILNIVRGARLVYILEEGIRRGGFAEQLSSALLELGYNSDIMIHAVDSEFPPHGDLKSLFDKYGFTSEEIAGRIELYSEEHL